jgi:hypothetical protein
LAPDRGRTPKTTRETRTKPDQVAPATGNNGNGHTPEPEPPLPPPAELGSPAPLARLESPEERAHARLQQALQTGDQFKIKAAQQFYLRASETLRRFDLAVETEKRNVIDQIPIQQVEDIDAPDPMRFLFLPCSS